jgi:hypothetical protein
MDAQVDRAPEAGARLPRGAKLAAIYFIVAGIVSIALLLGPQSREFLAKSAARRAGAYTREVVLDVAFIVAGVAVLKRLSWARKLGVTILVISTYYGTLAFAWGFSHGAPTANALLVASVAVGAWNTLWIYLLCFKSDEGGTASANTSIGYR